MYAVFFQLQFFLMVLPFGKDLKSYQELQITSFQLSLMKNQCLKTFFFIRVNFFSFNQISRITLHKIYQLPIKMQGSFTGDQKKIG